MGGIEFGNGATARSRSVVARLIAVGYVLKRRGKGDHSVYFNPETNHQITIDGGPNHELPKPVWQKIKKRLGWSDT
jgi:predicted RNA binding protein YcfA (HicA-like mRNA interferase family)